MVATMRIDAGQHMRLEQRMKLSPRMIQSMEILQLPALALEERIEQELETNPVLELRETLGEKPTPDEDDLVQPLRVDDTPAGGSSAEFNRAVELGERYGESWNQNSPESAEYQPRFHETGGRDRKMEAMANTASRGPGMLQQLLDQWRLVETDPLTRAAGEHILQFIDPDGYLRTGFDQLRADRPEFSVSLLESTLNLIHRRLDPPGIAARNLRECMLLQLDANTREVGDDDTGTHARLLVQHHLPDIEANRLPLVATRSGLSLDEINAAMARLKRLDPRPGRRLAAESPQVTVPDVLVEYDSVHDEYVAALTRWNRHPLRINPQYRRLAADRTQGSHTRQYLADQVNHARWLIDAIEQRNSTLLRVARVVIDEQRDFLDHGEQHLKPMPMTHVAGKLGIHVATVSRAVAEKTIQTPRGVFPLRMFFSGGIESSHGEELSWVALQAKLKALIDAEDPADPLSDEALGQKMKEAGVEIARRTVAKYRQQLNIPPARQRRRY